MFRRLTPLAAGCAVGVGLFASPLLAKETNPLLNAQLPHWLASNKTRYNHFATDKAADGSPAMTHSDLVRSLLLNPKKEIDVNVDRFAAFLDEVDSNNDGHIYYGDYCFLMVLLTTPPKDFEMMFKMFDYDSSGTIDRKEFESIIKACANDNEANFTFEGTLMEGIFNARSELSFPDFSAHLQYLQQQVEMLEFGQFDKQMKGTISTDQFAQLVCRALMIPKLPEYINRNLKNFKEGNNKVSFDQWRNFCKLMLISGDLANIITLFARSGKPVGRTEFNRAVESVSDMALSKKEVDLVFALFDRDGDGTIEPHEFYAVMRNRMKYNSGATVAGTV